MSTWWPYARLAAAALGLAALARQLQLVLHNALAADTPWGAHLPTVVTNFFSYFTILSNVLAAATLLIGAIWMLSRRRTATVEPAWLSLLFTCATSYIVVTGIVYNLLLRGIPLTGVSDVWTNETLHVVIPLVLLADALFAPGHRPLPWRAIPIVLVFPLAWAVYTMARANLITGPRTGNPWWYPYPFLDPHLVPGGYLGVTGYIIGIAAAIIGVAAGVVWIGRVRGRAPATPSSPETPGAASRESCSATEMRGTPLAATNADVDPAEAHPPSL